MQKKTIFLLSLVCLGSFAIKAQSKSERQVADAVKGLTRAMIDADKTKLFEYTSDQLSYGHSSGVVQTQNEFVDAIVSGKSDFVTIDLADQTLVVSGKTAIVRHKLSATTNDSGKPGTVKLSILLIWQRLHGRWVLLARQAVKVPV